MMVTVIGKGHSGTRAMSHTLSESGVFMGANLNVSGDLVPADEMYEACQVFGHYVRHLGGLNWDFSETFSAPIDPAFSRLVESYLSSVFESEESVRGWKLPETTLVLPWIIRMFPEIRFIYWVRDPRDSILGEHLTDDLARFGIPHDASEDIRQLRIASWIYQYEMMRLTPPPRHRIDVRFEEFVMNQAHTVGRLEQFLGMPLEKIAVRPESVGRWKSDPLGEPIAVFPPEALYEGILEESLI